MGQRFWQARVRMPHAQNVSQHTSNKFLAGVSCAVNGSIELRVLTFRVKENA